MNDNTSKQLPALPQWVIRILSMPFKNVTYVDMFISAPTEVTESPA